MNLLPLLFSMLGLFSAVSASAEVRFSERVQPYAITGSSPADLRGQMNTLGRRAMDGRIYDANTASDLKWHFTYLATSHECRIDSVLVLVEVAYHVPGWTGRDHAPRPIQERWDAFLERLLAHEHAHGAHARQAGEELERMILTTSPARYCEEVGNAANQRAEDVVKKLRRTDADYDERTQHGATEGAVYP